MTTAEQILIAALDLPAEERAHLVDALLHSLDDEASPATAQAQAQAQEQEELDRWLDAYQRDPAVGASWQEVKARLLSR